MNDKNVRAETQEHIPMIVAEMVNTFFEFTKYCIIESRQGKDKSQFWETHREFDSSFFQIMHTILESGHSTNDSKMTNKFVPLMNDDEKALLVAEAGSAWTQMRKNTHVVEDVLEYLQTVDIDGKEPHDISIRSILIKNLHTDDEPEEKVQFTA